MIPPGGDATSRLREPRAYCNTLAGGTESPGRQAVIRDSAVRPSQDVALPSGPRPTLARKHPPPGQRPRGLRVGRRLRDSDVAARTAVSTSPALGRTDAECVVGAAEAVGGARHQMRALGAPL